MRPFGRRGRTDNAAAAQRVKAWVREACSLDDATTVMVSELRCQEPGCPPLETFVAILEPGKDRRELRLHKALAEVGPDDVAALTRSYEGDRPDR